MLSILVVAIISRFLQHQQVTEQTWLAATRVYVLFGLIFALLIFGFNGITGRQFFVQSLVATFADFGVLQLRRPHHPGLRRPDTGHRRRQGGGGLRGLAQLLVTVVSRLASLYTGTKRSIEAGASAEPPPETPPAQ